MKYIITLALLVIISEATLLPRQKAPDFDSLGVVNNQIKRIKLSDYSGKWKVLLFFPMAFTFVCPTEIQALSNKAKDFRGIDTEVFALSTDTHHSQLAWVRTDPKKGGLGNVDVQLIADNTKEISKNYGVLVEDPNDPMAGLALRGLFVIDPSNTIRSVVVHDDQVGRSVDEAFRVVKAFQHADKHGVVCPATWKNNKDPTIVADPDKSQEYFRSQFKDL